MKKNLILAKDKVNKSIKDNSTKLSLAAAGIATLGATYLLGKTHGTKSYNMELYVTTLDEDGNPITTKIPELP